MFRRLGFSFAAMMAGTALAAATTPSATVAATRTQRTVAPGPALAPAPAPAPAPAAARRSAVTARARVANVAHRGASAYAPENTLPALRTARAQGADVIEVDVQQTKDRKLILMHDTTLARTTNVEKVFPRRAPYRVSSFTLKEIRRLDAGSWFGRRYKRTRVPTLDETLRAMRGGGVGLLVEIKRPRRYPGIERRVAAELRRHPSWLRRDPAERLLAVQSFDWASMRRFHAVMPRVPIGLLGKPAVGELRALARFADQINPPQRGLTASYVRRVHRLKMDVLTWTVNDTARMRRTIRLGVDGILTNKPKVLERALKQHRSREGAA
jgi:glycerophosphoryl diester phosphodiesterase